MPTYYNLPGDDPQQPAPLAALRALLQGFTLPGPTPQFQDGGGTLMDAYARAANGQAPIDPMGASLSGSQTGGGQALIPPVNPPPAGGGAPA